MIATASEVTRLNILEQNRQSWNAMADTWFGSTALPVYGCLAPTEDELHLFPPLEGARVLDFGCGSGHSLRWCAAQGASDLWGVDLSDKQIENAHRLLTECGLKPHLLRMPMESLAGLPDGTFDVAYAVYAIGWTTDLDATLAGVYRALKPGGVLIFSWDHPLMHCMDVVDEQLIFSGDYTQDETFSYTQRGQPVTIQNRRLSTYINALASAGFMIDRLIEETDDETKARPAEFTSGYYAPWKARKFPLSFIIRARKV